MDTRQEVEAVLLNSEGDPFKEVREAMKAVAKFGLGENMSRGQLEVWFEQALEDVDAED